MAHSRWLTTANRILRLYVSTNNPSEGLKLLARFVIKVCAPSWFEIKQNPKATYGARHLHQMIKKCAFLPPEYKSLVFDVIQRNAYFAHCENVLLSMLEDQRAHIRELALRKILKARKLQSSDAIRQFNIPTLNFQAEEYYNIISWEMPLEPAATLKLSDQEIKTLIATNKELDAVRLPCHTQAVERHIKLVTEASVAVCSEEARDGFIRARQKSRQAIPTFETKKEFFNSNI
uniref:Uncharacterized protein n=1 Tax=Cacopsylla melanoneura TaxID=428564 RepID=A0A8D8VVF7_9HEMI